MAANTFFGRAFWTLAACGLVYALAIGALTYPTVQRNATYAHNVNPTRWQNLNNTEQFGFLHHQIQPFTIRTSDNETIFAWHILPLHLYHKHESALKEQTDFGLKTYDEASKTVGLQLLFKDSQAMVVVSHHGNAAHLASSHRPHTYQQMLSLSTAERPIHVIAFDYRGFGLSTGAPTEDGVTLDSISVLSAITGHVDKVESSAGQRDAVQPSQVILLGQSLGTFVSTAAYHRWVLELGRAPFRGLVLLASFKSLTSLLDSYSVKGLTPPILSPLLAYPKLQYWIREQIVDKWETSERLQALVQAPNVKLDLTMMHARDDWEIPWREGRASWDQVMDAAAAGSPGFEHSLDYEEWTSEDGDKHLLWERVRHGGHNRLATSEHAKLAVLRVIERNHR